MEDVFGYNSDLSALGVGKSRDFHNQLIEAPDDDVDINLLNEDTFGDGAEAFDWEDDHALDRKAIGNKTKDSGYDTVEKSFRTQEEYMEQSISQLVVDDDDELDDPSIINISKRRPIPKSKQNLDDLFGPSSPPSFLDAATLISPTSKNIWSPPVRVATPLQNQQPNTDKLQSLFEYARAAKSNNNLLDDPAIVGTRKALENDHRPQSPASNASTTGMLMPHAQTVEELESEMLRQPKVFTAADLERHLRSETPPVMAPRPPGQYSVPVPIPLMHNGYRGPPPPFTQAPPGYSPLQSHLMDGRISPVQIYAHGRVTPPPMPMPIGSPMMANMPLNRQSPLVTGMPVATPIGRSPSPPMSGHYPGMSPARMMSPYPRGPMMPMFGPNMAQNRMFQNQMGGPPHPMPNARPSGFSPYGSPSGPRMPPPQSPYNDHGQMHPRNRGHNTNNNMSNIRPPQPYYRNLTYFRERRERHPSYNDDQDPYAGLMTQREKDWIIKIQLMQLQTDNPYLDDFYYTTFSMRKKAKERQRQRENGDNSKNDEPKLVIPAMAKMETKAYKPAHFEGSLGRLTTSSVHNPRQIIDFKNLSHGSEETGSKNASKDLRRYRQLLMDIENAFNLLLDIDDIEKRVLALPEEARVPLFVERSEMIHQLHHYMSGQVENLLQIMSVRKGRKLVVRVLQLLEIDQSNSLLLTLLKHLQYLFKRDQAVEGLMVLYDIVSRLIQSANMESLVKFADQIQTSGENVTKSITSTLQNKFGSSVMCCLLSRGEELYSTESPLDMDNELQSAWSQIVQTIAEVLDSTTISAISRPARHQANIAKHLDRVINKKLAAAIEDKVHLFTEPLNIEQAV